MRLVRWFASGPGTPPSAENGILGREEGEAAGKVGGRRRGSSGTMVLGAGHDKRLASSTLSWGASKPVSSEVRSASHGDRGVRAGDSRTAQGLPGCDHATQVSVRVL
jgi:hypothetical protein